MNVYLQQSFDWIKKWFFGSSSTVVGTIFFGDTFATKFGFKLSSVYWSVFIGFFAVVVVFIARFFYLLIKDTGNFNKTVQKYEEEIARLNENLATKAKLGHTKTPKPFIRSEIKYEVYGEAILLLKDAFSHAHRLRKEENITVEDNTHAMMYLCEKLKNLFEENTNKIYSVCIKIIKINDSSQENQGNFDKRLVYTLFSDLSSRRQREHHYNKPISLANDVCYDHIRKTYQDSFYYLNNNIPIDMSYYSSFFDTYPWPSQSQPATLEERVNNWTLPYRSELVVPIYPIQSLTWPFEKKGQVRGFLCIDCNQINGFNLKYDSGMLQGIADGIYDLVTRAASE